MHVGGEEGVGIYLFDNIFSSKNLCVYNMKIVVFVHLLFAYAVTRS